MVEVMFFSQLEKAVHNHPEAVEQLFLYDMERRISFKDASEKWPAIAAGAELDFGSEPLQSMRWLSKCRNNAIHHTASTPQINVGESAFFTAIEASKAIYNHFNQGGWCTSEYARFVESNQPSSKTYLQISLPK